MSDRLLLLVALPLVLGACASAAPTAQVNYRSAPPRLKLRMQPFHRGIPTTVLVAIKGFALCRLTVTALESSGQTRVVLRTNDEHSPTPPANFGDQAVLPHGATRAVATARCHYLALSGRTRHISLRAAIRVPTPS